MEFGLQKIVLIDSYVEGRASEIDVSGHTNISGDNGIGKTSFLKLVPIFYGEQPRRLIMESANGNEGFNQFYLPRTGSYLVFEYLSHGQPRMVVFCNQRERSRHRHVFIDSPYREDIFMDVEKKEILPAHSLLTRLNASGLQHLNVDTTQQYRKILLDGTVPKAYHFSMCPRNSRLSKLTPLFTGMFKRDVQFADLSRVIQEYAMDKLDEDARQILENFSVHRDHLTTTLKQYDAYKALEKVRPEAEDLSRLLDEYGLANRKLSSLVVAAKSKVTDLDIEYRACDEAIGKINITIASEGTEHEAALGKLDEDIKSIKEKRGPVATAIEDLKRNKTSYDQKNMPEWQRKLEGIAQLEERHDSYDKQLTVLEEKSASIREPIEREMAAAKDTAQDELERLNAQYKKISGEHNKDRKRISDRQTSEIREQAQNQQRDASSILSDLGKLNTSISALEERFRNPQASVDLVRQHEIAEAAKEKAQDLTDNAYDALRNAERKHTAAKDHYQNAEERFKKARIYCEEVEDQYNEVLGLINGQESSLIYFLNNNKPGWENTLGRVLTPNILREKNLSPEVDEQDPNSTSLCGIQIDFSRLPEQELTPAALQARLEELTTELSTAEADEKAAESALNEANRARESANNHESTCNEAYKRLFRELEDARNTLKKVRAEKEQSERDNKAATELELKGLYESRESLSEKSDQLQELHEEQARELEALHQAQIEEFENSHAIALEQIEDSRRDAINTRNKDLSRLQKHLDQALAGQQIDPREIAALKKQVDDLRKEIKSIREKEALISSFRRFIEEEYSQLPDHEAKLDELDKHLVNIRNERKAEVTRWENRKKDLIKKAENKEQEMTQAGSDANTLRVSILQTAGDRHLFVREDDENLALYREMRASNLIRDYQSLLQTESAKLNELKKLGTRFATIFEKYSGTPSTQYWQETVMDWDGTDEQIITRARAVLEYFNGGKHDLVRETLASGFSNLDQIDIYRSAMEGFDKRIRRFNRELSGHIQENLNFPAIERVEPTITFELDELDYWKDIKAVADGVRAWRENYPLNSLPDDDLVLSLRNYLDTFEESRANVSVKELWRLIRFRFSIIENGHHKVGSSSKDLASSEGLSSNGLSYIVLIVLFLGFIDMHRSGQPVHLSWALDELRAFSNKNKRVLLDMLTDHNISLVTACPDMEDRELSIFNQVYMMDRTDGDRRFIRWNTPEPVAVAANNPFKDLEPAAAGQQGDA